MSHLDDAKLEALLKDPKGQPDVAAHLREGCEQCEAFLEQHGHPLLDGATDDALLSLAPATLGDEVQAERTFRRITGTRRRSWVAIAVACAAVVAAAAVYVVLRPHDDGGGIKGPALLTLELSAVQRSTLARVVDGQTLKSNDEVLLRVHASDAASGWVALQRTSGAPELLGPITLEPGTHDVMLGSQLVAVSLEDEKGLLRIWVIASKGAAPPSKAEAERALYSATSLSAAKLEVNVSD